MSHVESRDIHTNNEPGYQKNKQGIAVGFDEGAVVVTMGREEPVRNLYNRKPIRELIHL